jgi:exopolyphosphatase / guanosine-5'-triphosphate,3'-diphosphate pyrophosphatase
MESQPSRGGGAGGAADEAPLRKPSPPIPPGGPAPGHVRLAALDIGTHAAKLLVADVATTRRGIGFRPLVRLGRVTRLGGEGGPGRPIPAPAAERAAAASAALLAHARELGVQRVIAAGTGVLRRAPNGRAVARDLARSLRIELPVLEPQVEAALSFLGLRAGLGLDPPLVAVDVGGGTTELIELTAHGLHAHSLDLGCLDLSARHLRGERPRAEELRRVERELVAAVPSPLVSHPRPGWAAVGGTISGLAAIDLELDAHDPDRTHGHLLKRRALAGIVRRETGRAAGDGEPDTGNGERGSWSGERGQREVLLAGAMILLHLLRIHRVTSILASSWGLRQGLLLAAVLAPEERAGRDPRRSAIGAFALASGPRPEILASSRRSEPGRRAAGS